MRVLRQTRALCMGCIFTAIFAFFTSCGARLSPEAQDVFDRYNKIHQEMTEQDVDAIFNGYSARRVNEVYEADGEGKPLPRPSAYSKLYSPKGAAEFDDVILIHFDRDGRVVGKRRETYIR